MHAQHFWAVIVVLYSDAGFVITSFDLGTPMQRTWIKYSVADSEACHQMDIWYACATVCYWLLCDSSRLVVLQIALLDTWDRPTYLTRVWTIYEQVRNRLLLNHFVAVLVYGPHATPDSSAHCQYAYY